MRGALLVCKKEFLELSKDRKTLLFTFVLPLVLYPLIFTMIGALIQTDSAKRMNKPSRVLLKDPGMVLQPVLQADPKAFQLVTAPEGNLKQSIRDQKLEMMVEVEPTAPARLARQETFSIKATLDESDESSRLALDRLKDALKKQDSAWTEARLKGLGASVELAVPTRLETENAGDMVLLVGKMLGGFLPYLLMLIMFTGSMQLGIYATAGEKERGTLLSLLSTRLPRIQIIFGKILYVFSIGLISALINLLSVAFSFSRFFVQVSADHAAGAVHTGSLAALANPVTIGLTFLLMIPLGLFFANFIVLMGVQAKNSQEAGTSMMPGIVVVVMLAVFSMAPGIEKMNFLPYVPVLNVSLAIRKLFSQQASAIEYLIALFMTIGLAGAMTWLSTRILDRESAIFKQS